MPSFLFSLLAATALLLAVTVVRGSPLDDRVSQFKHAIQKEADAKAADNNAGVQGGFRNPALSATVIGSEIDRLVVQMQNPANGPDVDTQLAQITTVFTSDEVQETAKNLLDEIHKERKDRADAEATELKALLQRVGDKVNQAQKPEELDDVIADLGKRETVRNQGGGNGQNQALYQQAAAALEFAKRWQDYLSHAAHGENEQVQRDLENLSQNSSSATFIPRSKLLALEEQVRTAVPAKPPTASGPAPASPVQDILDGIKTLDDLAPALARLQPIRQGSGEAQNACNALEQMLDAYRNLKAGLPAQVNLGPSYGTSSMVPMGVRAQLILLALQGRFESYKGTPPAAGEKPADFVNRVIADATAREDWALLKSALLARTSLEQTGLGYSFSNQGGVDNLIAASHQEAAGQYTLAVASYEAALKSSDDAVPARAIGDKLAAIERDHPKDYADGLQITISPPSPRQYEAPAPGPRAPFGIPGLAAPSNYPTATVPPTLLSPTAGTHAAPAAPAAK